MEEGSYNYGGMEKNLVRKTGGINGLQVWGGNEQRLFSLSKFFLHYCSRNDS